MLDESVALESSHADWPAIFESERRRLARALGTELSALEHIGSTAVRGLIAKPIVDIMVGSVVMPCPDSWSAALTGLGYEAMGEAGVPGRWYFRHRETPLRNVHVVERCGAHWINNLALRDYLRKCPEARSRYADAKRQAVASGATQLLAYSRQKRSVVETLLAEALSTSLPRLSE